MKAHYLLSFAIGFIFFTTSVKAEQSYTPPTLPTIPNKVFNIQSYGAVSNNSTDNTKAIQKAIDVAEKAGGGKVEIPAGTYLCGPLAFASNIDLQLDKGAILRFLPFNRYPGGIKEGRSFINGDHLHDIAITGEGTIDGQGSPWWPYAKVKNARRPRMIVFHNCDRILLKGIKLMNSPKFHIAIGGKTTDVTVEGITVRAPASTDPVNPSHNTDACDVSGHHILVENCDISTGDDDYTCSGGTSDVLLRNNKYGNGHGVSIGSHTRGIISNITVENCTFTNTDCGIRLKSDRDRGGLVQNLTYKNLTMTNVKIPILIYEQYMAPQGKYRKLQKLTSEIAATYPSAPVTKLTPDFRNISFINIKATAAKGKRAGLIWGLPESPVKNVLMKNVDITADYDFGIYFAKGVHLENCVIKTKSGVNKFDITNSDITMDGKIIK